MNSVVSGKGMIRMKLYRVYHPASDMFLHLDGKSWVKGEDWAWSGTAAQVRKISQTLRHDRRDCEFPRVIAQSKMEAGSLIPN